MTVKHRPIVTNVSWVLLPGELGPYRGHDQAALGPYTVAISGNILFDVIAPSDDDYVSQDRLFADIDHVEWVPHRRLQATTMISWGEIVSPDFDEADHARWGVIGPETGHKELVRNGAIVWVLRLGFDLVIQGKYNRWSSLGFQTIANGTLVDPNVVYQRANVTKPI